MKQKEEAYNEIAKLVERFGEQYDSYKKADYNETLTRRDFIDPFFKALGWDIDNQNGYAEAYREVIHEDKVKVGKATKAPDYSFRLVGGKRLFFVEAKKPSVVVKDDMQPAYQVRRYGWSAKLPVSIITDFEEFAIYDCIKKPLPTDKASVARIKYLTFKDYLNEFEFLWDAFSKERVLKGSFDKFVQGNLNKKGTATVDKEFLQSLDSWRTYLASSISWNNKELDEDEINFVVQQTIDRIIFLRIAEDRSVELYGNLQQAIKQGNFYQNLFHQFQQADDKYNSGLFDFKKDKISKSLSIDNKVLKTIINELYYPESPYEFSVLSVEILGSAYEQFLGKVIRIDKAHRAHIEEKPEVRKAGGVYYTPQYIVEYIVKNTVGKLAPLTPDAGVKITPTDVAKIKICDPACGSGSFLIGAYDYLLKWHNDYYFKNPSEAKKAKAITATGSLTTSIKKQILLNNIYGVDIDVNAVEVTKLSLLLKCMEGETEASINHQLTFFHERVLPTLDDNIKDGNSLIDTDFYDNQFDFGEEKKIKPFNWQKGFPEVFKINEPQAFFDFIEKIKKDLEITDLVTKSKELFSKNVELKRKLGISDAEIIDVMIVEANKIFSSHSSNIFSYDKENLSKIIKEIDDPTYFIPKNKLKELRALISFEEPKNYNDFIELSANMLSLILKGFNHDLKFIYLHLLTHKWEFLENFCVKNNIDRQRFIPEIQRRFLTDLVENFDDYERFYSQNQIPNENAGFDVVIGNPPYGATLTKEVDDYLRRKYQVANYQLDTYILFIERGKKLLNQNGSLGFIIPSAWVASTYDNKLRKYLAEENRIENFVITPKQTFKDASVETCILVLSNNSPSKSFEVERWDEKEKISYTINTKEIKTENAFAFPVYSDDKTNKVVQKIRKQKNILNDFADVVWGVKIYENGKGKPSQKGNESKTKVFHSDKKTSKTHRPLLGGSEIIRYATKWKGGFVDYGEWLAAPRQPHWFDGERILIRDVTANGIIQGTFVDKDFVFSNSVDGIKMKSKDLNIKFLLGLINSKLISFYHSNTSANAFKGTFPKVLLQDLRTLPVPKAETKIQNEIVKLVNQLLQLNQQKVETKLATQVSQLQGKIDFCESRINEIVYQLYELTPSDIKIVEGK